MDYTNVIKELFYMQQAYATLFSVTNKLQISGDEYLESLTTRQLMTIVAILHLPEDETTINNIAKKMGTTKQNVNRLLAGLEKKRYLTIFPSQKDKRAVNVKLTESGQSITLSSAEKNIYFMADIFNNFTTEEVETLWNLLKKLYKYDGQEQDGFEEDADALKTELSLNEVRERALATFAKLRSAISNEDIGEQ
jgi:DNA-binding MarR family transcriptional regulator